MFKLLSILFFGSVINLGNSTIDINPGSNNFQLQKPISAFSLIWRA